MDANNTKINRIFGYDILINNFEALLRKFIADDIFLINYGNDWSKHIPEGVWLELNEIKKEEIEDIKSINDFFDELNFLQLKDILKRILTL